MGVDSRVHHRGAFRFLHPVNADGSLGTDEIGVNLHPTDKIHSGWSLLDRARAVIGANAEGVWCTHNGGARPISSKDRR